MPITFQPIGTVETDARSLPRHWSVSDVEGELVIDIAYQEGLVNIKRGQRIVVLFCFHKSPKFNGAYLKQTPPHRQEPMGVFSICSPFRHNPLGMSVLDVIGIERNVIRVRGLDMIDGTPLLDIKPHISDREDCPSYEGNRRPGTP